MSLLVAPMVAAFLYLIFKSPHFADKGMSRLFSTTFSAVLSNSQSLSVCMDVFFIFQDKQRDLSACPTTP